MSIPCLDRDHFDFERFVKKRMNDAEDSILSAEWCFCGRGIPLLYEFYLNKDGKHLENQVAGENIFTCINSDEYARKTFNRFLYMFGALLMSNCSVLLPDDGIVLCGSILNCVIKHMENDMSNPETSYFYKGFLSNPCINDYLKTIPIYFTPELDMGKKGCQV